MRSTVLPRTLGPTLLILAATLTSSAACGPRRVVVNGVEMSYEDAATRVLEEGRKAKTDGDVPTAKVRFKEVLDLFDDSARVPDALAELGDIFMAEGGCRAARLYLEELAEKHPLHPRSAAAKQSLAACEGQAGAAAKVEGPLSTFDTDFSRAATDAERKHIASTAVDAASEAGDFGGAVRWLLRVQKLETEEAQKQAVRDEITDLIDSRVTFQDVRTLLEELEGDDFPKPLLTYKLARIQYHTRDLENARESLKRYLTTWPKSSYEAGAKQLLAAIEARQNVKPRAIGVLLPLSGKNRVYGESALQAIRLAFEAEEGKKASSIALVVRDTKSDRVAAAQAVEELVLQEGVIAIVGPMFTNESQPAAFKAQELGVPLLTISSADEVGNVGPYVFRNGLTYKAQAEALVSYAMDVAGMKTFAVLYPRHPYGEELLHLFWDEVEKRKGEIRGVESYGTEDTTFAAQVKSLVARDVLGMRSDYRKAIEECDKQPDNYRKARCRDRATQEVRPLVDFDGLFIPDYPPKIALISAALAFEDIIVEKDPRQLKKIEKTLGREVTPVTLLGASGWNSSELPEKAQRNVENAVFVDAFFSGAEDKPTVELVNTFQKKLKRTPSVVEALAYDSAMILRGVVEGESPATRDAMREGLRRVAKFPGVTGQTSFTESPDAKKKVRLLTIKEGRIQEIALPENGTAAGEDPDPQSRNR